MRETRMEGSGRKRMGNGTEGGNEGDTAGFEDYLRSIWGTV